MNKIDYLRISLLDRCNFRCQYCIPEGDALHYLQQQELLTDDEILELIQYVFIPIGLTKFRLTGGEPLLRPGVVELVRKIAAVPQIQDLSMTTNGFHLDSMAQSLYDVGLHRINISLDSLDPYIFEQLIGNHGRGRWQKVWQGIQTAYRVGFDPLKLNVVVIPGVNDHEILDLAALTINQNWHVRFIEFMPIGNFQLFSDRGWVCSADIRKSIRDHWGLAESSIPGNGPADVFKIPGARGTIGFISQMSECFCDRCNRIRLSADGWLRPCLLNESGQIDLKTALRSGVSMDKLQEQIKQLLGIKQEINFQLRNPGTSAMYTRTMSQIGG
jgi:cyclic pyranopterin phosphate synthase